MAMELHEQPHHENIWLSVGLLSPASSFPSAPWEQRHRQELAIRDTLSLAYKQHSSDTLDEKSRNDDNYMEPNTQFLNSDVSRAGELPFQLTSIREAELVSRCLYALQGIPVAVTGLQLLAKLYSCQVADRSLHRLPSLWQRSSSTKALGKLLTTFVQAGCVRCQLEEFVHFFLKPQTQGYPVDQLYTDLEMQSQLFMKSKKRGKRTTKHQQKLITTKEEELNFSPPYSLVNQAFAKAVKTILRGHLAALNTLTSSVVHRRSTNDSQSFDSACLDEHVGAVIGLPSCDMTLLELHLHTKTLRIQLQALASICLCSASAESFGLQEWNDHGAWLVEGESSLFEKFSSNTVLDFKTFPRGADLLTFLYRRLQESDRVHVELLQYLFSCACQPYLVFVHSWLYHAKVNDPYKEFIVDEAVAMAASVSQLLRKERSLLHSKVQASVSAPCFLEDICTPLIRSGQQLQVLLKLVETGVADNTYKTTSFISNGFRMLECALKGWTELASENSVFSPVLIFNKEKLDELVEHRQRKRDELMKDFDSLFSNLHSQNQIYEGFNVLESRQGNSQSVACNTDGAMPEGLTVLNMTEGSSCSAGKGDLEDGEELDNEKENPMPLEILSECLVLSGSGGEEACGIHENDNETHDCEQENLSKRVGTETEDPVCSEAEKDQPFTSECNRVSKQRKKWIEPLEVVVVHGQLDEEVSLVCRLDAEKMDLYQSMPFISDHEAEADTLYNRFSGNHHLDLSISDGVSSHGYNLPSLSQASFWSESELKGQAGGPSLQSLTLAKNQRNTGFSFFFSDICVEEIGPEFFGRSYIRRLAQGYQSPSLPQSDSYKKNAADFDAISQKFWNFEDCTCSGSLDMKFLPAFSFTNVVETLNFRNRNMHLPYSEDKMKLSDEIAEGQLYQSNKKIVSSTPATSGLCNQSSLHSKFEPSVEFQDEMPTDRIKGDMKLEEMTKDFQKKQGSAYGGASWQSYLGLKGSEVMGAGAFTGTALESSEIPLEVIVDKCIIQEVLSQYHCISHFSVRLLHEVFGLPEHLAALRRYFFMERGDWADTFTGALYHHVWYPTGSQQRQLEVQTLLEAALQNSSCQEDDYAERLYVSVKTKGEHVEPNTDNLDHIFIKKNSLSAFDFIILGYRLEWPISLIIPSEIFHLYNAMFSFLVRAKLAVHALGDIWRFLKELLFVSKRGNVQTKQEWINILMLFRQQVSHFITTLQGHLESQLLHNVWCKFLHALHHEGKDLQNLETLHELYLQDALHVCFLSDEMQPVRRHVEDIMQGLLDLSSCLNIFGKQEDGKPTLESEKVQSVILDAKRRYESSIEGLCQIAFNSHHQLSLSQFWTRLDFNGFFGDICSRVV